MFNFFKKFIFTLIFILIATNIFSLSTLLPTPDNLISFNSTAGIKLFSSSHSKEAFWKLMPYFITEQGLSYCAIASGTIVLNAEDIKPPFTASHFPYSIFDQYNFFTPKVLKIISPASVGRQGVTLSQLADSLKTFDISVVMYHGRSPKMNIKRFRHLAIAAVSSSHQFIIVNICRKYIHEQGCGHFSPLVAYNKKADRFLFLDVARYKYPPVWIKTMALYKALSTGNDSVSHQSRGFIIVKS